MFKITITLCFLTFCGLIQAFPVQEDPDDQKTGTGHTKHINIGDSSAIPAVYVTPFPNTKVDKDKKTTQDKQRSNENLEKERTGQILLDDNTDQKSDSTERHVRDTEGSVPASYQDQQNSSQNTSQGSSTQRADTGNVDRLSDRQVRDTEGKVDRLPGSYQDQQNSAGKIDYQSASQVSSTQSSSTENVDGASDRQVRDTQGQLPGNYQDQQSSTEKNNYQSASQSSSTKNVDGASVSNAQGQLPGTYKDQQSSTKKNVARIVGIKEKHSDGQRITRQVSDNRKSSENQPQGGSDDKKQSFTAEGSSQKSQGEKLVSEGWSAQNGRNSEKNGQSSVKPEISIF